MFDHYLAVLASDQPFTEDHISSTTNWQVFCTRMINEGMASLFYPKLETVKDFLPEDVLGLFRSHYENAVIFKDFAVQILKDLQSDLASVGTVVITQGLALSETIYPEPLCRTMGDVDLFLPEGNMRRVRDVFLEYGFTPYRDYENVLEYNQIMIDLHEGLWGTDRFTQREYVIPRKNVSWRPSKLIPGFFVLSPDDLALHCAFHGVKHGFNKGVWDCDLVRLYNTGYLTPHAQNRQEYVLKYMTFSHLRFKKILPARLSEKNTCHTSLLIRVIVDTLAKHSDRPGFGQVMLSFLCPSLTRWLHYMSAVIIPPKRILQQMYGRSVFVVLVMKRVWKLMNYGGRVLFKWR